MPTCTFIQYRTTTKLTFVFTYNACAGMTVNSIPTKIGSSSSLETDFASLGAIFAAAVGSTVSRVTSGGSAVSQVALSWVVSKYSVSGDALCWTISDGIVS